MEVIRLFEWNSLPEPTLTEVAAHFQLLTSKDINEVERQEEKFETIESYLVETQHFGLRVIARFKRRTFSHGSRLFKKQTLWRNQRQFAQLPQNRERSFLSFDRHQTRWLR